MYTGIKQCVCNGNVKIKAITEIYKVSLSVYSASNDQITSSLAVVTGRNVSLFFHGEAENDHYDALLPIEEKQT
jgi:hypothetical protein